MRAWRPGEAPGRSTRTTRGGTKRGRYGRGWTRTGWWSCRTICCPKWARSCGGRSRRRATTPAAATRRLSRRAGRPQRRRFRLGRRTGDPTTPSNRCPSEPPTTTTRLEPTGYGTPHPVPRADAIEGPAPNAGRTVPSSATETDYPGSGVAGRASAPGVVPLTQGRGAAVTVIDAKRRVAPSPASFQDGCPTVAARARRPAVHQRRMNRSTGRPALGALSMSDSVRPEDSRSVHVHVGWNLSAG